MSQQLPSFQLLSKCIHGRTVSSCICLINNSIYSSVHSVCQYVSNLVQNNLTLQSPMWAWVFVWNFECIGTKRVQVYSCFVFQLFGPRLFRSVLIKNSSSPTSLKLTPGGRLVLDDVGCYLEQHPPPFPHAGCTSLIPFIISIFDTYWVYSSKIKPARWKSHSPHTEQSVMHWADMKYADHWFLNCDYKDPSAEYNPIPIEIFWFQNTCTRTWLKIYHKATSSNCVRITLIEV